jgi:hypothetical protein
MDELNAWYWRDEADIAPGALARTALGMHFHPALAVIEKRRIGPPVTIHVGSRRRKRLRSCGLGEGTAAMRGRYDHFEGVRSHQMPEPVAGGGPLSVLGVVMGALMVAVLVIAMVHYGGTVNPLNHRVNVSPQVRAAAGSAAALPRPGAG